MGKFKEAAAAWQAASDKYSEYGAGDTEPRAEFAILVEKIIQDRVGDSIPRTVDDWQLFDIPGSKRAALALHRAAVKCVKAGKDDMRGAVAWYKYTYGYEPF